MELKNRIEIYKKADFTLINDFEKSFTTKVDEILISKLIEITFKGNYNLDMVFSVDKKHSLESFLFKAFKTLEYVPFEEISEYKYQVFSYHKMLQELSFIETKEALTKNSILEKNCVTVIKLKEKDELTFLIETKSNYVFISEIYWKS
jgi:hypothetical protein